MTSPRTRMKSREHQHPHLRSARAFLICVTASVVALSCLARSCRPGRSHGPSVVLVPIESLRPDVLASSPLSDARDPIPSIRGLAAHGRSWRGIATSSDSLPSLASILTGAEPAAHGLLVDGVDRLPPPLRTLAERFAEAGYATGGFP